MWAIGKNLKVPIRHNYKQINKLGQDRLANVYGAVKIYKPPLLILDYGTALTCDYVSSKGAFEGGLIIPGPEIALSALYERTALLPKVNFPIKQAAFIGRDPKGCMKAGILQGYGAMTDGLIERFHKRYGKRFQVVATGGLAKAIFPHTAKVDILDPLLTLKSLHQLFEDLTP